MRPARNTLVLLIAVLVSSSSCRKPDPGPNGATCTTHDECQSDLCYHEVCLDPLGDEDGDGLVNKVEALVTGTRADDRDTDGDGFDDLTEVGTNPSAPVDSDEDGVHNAMESAIADSDCDGLADQYDNPDWENDPGSVGVPDPDNPESCLADSDQDGIPNLEDNCVNIPNADQTDQDGDGVGEVCDLCTNGPDDLDQDDDGIPDDCDLCKGGPDGIDLDGDGVPGGCDICPGGDDNGPDGDLDGVPDDCDICPAGDDNGLDGDQDGVPIECDICPGFDDHADADQDSIPDGCDDCPLGDDALDTDQDGVPDGCDLCPQGPASEEGGCDGLCSTTADCDDGDPCSNDLCDVPTNQCAHALAVGCGCLSATDCDDGNACTHDTCGQGSICSQEDIAGCCLEDAACDDGVQCTVDTCDTTTLTCSNVPDPEPCDDGDTCTLDACDPSVGCVDIAPTLNLSGLSENHQGNLLWNVFGDGPEPSAQGHLVCGVNAFYYLASRDYDGIDEQSPGSFHLTGADGDVFSGLLEALENTGHTLEDVHWRLGLMSLGEDVEGQDWWWETELAEVRHYYPAPEAPPTLSITLGTTLMLSGTLQHVTSRTVFPENCDGSPTDISGHTSPVALVNIATTLSDASLVAEALLGDLGGEGLQIRFSSLQPAVGATYDVDGRVGAFFENQAGVLARVPLSCEPE